MVKLKIKGFFVFKFSPGGHPKADSRGHFKTGHLLG